MISSSQNSLLEGLYRTWHASLLDAFLISLGLLFLLHRYSSRQVLCHLIRMDQDGLAASKASTSPLEGRDAFYSDSGRPRFCAIFSVFARFCAHILRPLHHYAISFLHCQPLFLPLNDFAPIITARRYSLTTLMFHIHQTIAKQVHKITSFYIHISFTK